MDLRRLEWRLQRHWCLHRYADAILTIDAIFTQALRFVAVTPCRLVDTRNPTVHSVDRPGLTARSFPKPQLHHVNPSTAAAYSLNVTLVPMGGHSVGYLTIWPTGEGAAQ